MADRRARALESVIVDWLPHLGTSPEAAPAVVEQVADQLSALPGPLRLGVGVLDRGLSILPRGSVLRLAALPGAAEYVRLVRSLATVVVLADQEAAP